MTLTDLEQTIGIVFADKNLLQLAFIHRSYLNESKIFHTSNERLEFLGDAVLALLTSHFLYKRYPEFPEGTLTNIRSGLVKTKTLSEAAQKLGLGELLRLSRGEEDSGGKTNPSLLADAFEALLGVIFLDRGIEAADHFLQTFLFPKVTEIVAQKSYLDYKSMLQEVVQQQSRATPIYRLVKSAGPDHAKTFWMEVVVGDEVLGEGSGKSKQEAEQSAAANALEKLNQT